MQRVTARPFAAGYDSQMLFRPKKLALPPRQQAIVDHLGRWLKNDAERARYTDQVEKTLRDMPGCSDLKVSAACIKAALNRR